LDDRRPGEKIDLINAGISGHKVPDLLARFERDVAAKKPKTVVIYIGVNDVWHEALNGKGTPPKEFADGLALLIKKTKDIGAVPILLTLAVVGERTDGKNSLDKKLDEYAVITLRVAKENGVVARDLRKAFMDHLRLHNKDQRPEGILTNDGVHMLPAGNEAILEEVAAGILESLR
jgi:lysophospholipase L1-like esterase